MTPWLGSPTSYASGYMSAQRTSQLAHGLTVELSSPPTYWIGFCTCGSRASSCGNTDSAASAASAGISEPLCAGGGPPGRGWGRVTIQPNPIGEIPPHVGPGRWTAQKSVLFLTDV